MPSPIRYIVPFLLGGTILAGTGLAGTGLGAYQAAQAQAPTQAPSATQIPNDAVLRLAGSNTVGQKLAAMLAAGWARKIGLPAIRTDAGAAEEEYSVIAERAEASRRLRVDVRAHGSTSGAEPLFRSQIDIWMSSRQARESDLEASRKKNVPGIPSFAQITAPGNEHVIALDALAVLVHPRNPVQKLSVAQIKDIYSGKLTNWADVGGPSLPIIRYSRESNSGTFDTFCTLVMGIGDAPKCTEAMGLAKDARFESSEDLSDTVASNPSGIGFVGVGYIRGARTLDIASACGLTSSADVFLIKADEYPLSRRLYLYTMPGRAMSPTIREFLQFTFSTDGQARVVEAGFVNLLASAAKPDYMLQRIAIGTNAFDGGRLRVRGSDVQELARATNGAERLSITFRFRAGSNTLDSLADADIARLAALLRTPAYEGAEVALVGFSQAAGDYQENRALSKERAEAVRDRLTADHGLKEITAYGVGPASPVACNNEAASAGRNQRVEVWIRGKGARG